MFTFDELSVIANEIAYKDWTLRIKYVDQHTSIIQWLFVEDDKVQQCRQWTVDHTQPKSDVIRTALAAAIMAEEHEVREQFKYKGKKVFNPHLSVEKMVEIAGKLENLDLPE